MNSGEGAIRSVGLSSTAAAERLRSFGANEIRREKGRPGWRLLLEQFESPLVVILVIACFISVTIGERVEAVAIGAILVLNALIGFFQVYRAETAIHALREMVSPRARVLRDGRQTIIAAHDVVPGDLLLLEAGDIVAADAEVLVASQCLVNEAVLTGESIPVEKMDMPGTSEERSTKVFMGTVVASGTASATVSATGMKTELGRIAHLISTAQTEPTPLQIQLAYVGKVLLVICLGLAAIVAAVGYYQGLSWMELLIFSLSLSVAAVPEGMPAIVTMALAMGVQRLAACNALIRKLPSVETLGSVTVICTDKTGTLTTGNMRVRELWGDDHQDLIEAAASCCDAELEAESEAGTGDPSEIAILIEARGRGIQKEVIERENPRISTEPFDAVRRRMAVSRRDGRTYLKGAVESLVPLCFPSGAGSNLVSRAAGEMSARGLRVLAVAVGEGPERLKLLGLVGLADPPRTEAMQAIREARAAGILPVMITGDHPLTAASIARELGLVLEGEAIEGRVHSRATPEDKLQLVRHWKKQGAVVAMTGDGVNDAPALREAHIGIAMGRSGTEVTKQAADLVLADDNFATIVTAVREGRSIFQNIRKAITYLLTGNFAEVMIVLGAISLGLPLPLLAAHLLWINLVTDALPALTLVAEPLSPDLMKRAPRAPEEKILERSEWIQIIFVGLLEAFASLVLFSYLLKVQGVVYARNLLFTTFVCSQLLRSFSARSGSRVFWEVGVFSNLWLLGVALVTFALQLSLHYFPLSQRVFELHALEVSDFLLMVPVALIPVSVIELSKLAKRV